VTRRDSDQEWEKFGRDDPYFGVTADEKHRHNRLDDDSLRDFFKSGQDHIDFVLATIRTSVDSEFLPSRALDFGCGVGRCSIPLTRVCQSVVGVDVSDSMLQEARKNCSEHAVSNLRLVKSDDTLSQVSGPFDFVHSFVVFQHIPRKRGEEIFTRLVELLSDNGVAAVEFLYGRNDPAAIRLMGFLRKKIMPVHMVANLLYGRPFTSPLMEKNVYDLNRLLTIIHEHGCGNLHLRCQEKGGMKKVHLFFQKSGKGLIRPK